MVSFNVQWLIFLAFALLITSSTSRSQVVFDDSDSEPVQQQPPTYRISNHAQENHGTSAELPSGRAGINGLRILTSVPGQLSQIAGQILRPFVPRRTTERPYAARNEADICRTFDNGIGTCTTFTRCPNLQNILSNHYGHEANRILRHSICGLFNSEPLVCCPTASNNNGGFLNGGPNSGDGGQRSRVVVVQNGPRPGSGGRPPATEIHHEGKNCKNAQRGTQFESNSCREHEQSRIVISSTSKPRSTTATSLAVTAKPTRTGVGRGNLNVSENEIISSAFCGVKLDTHTRIVGGSSSEKGSWPWLVALGYRDGESGGVSFLCGGALVSDVHVLTAAHCAYKREDLIIARLNDWDLYSSDDGVTPLDLRVEKAYPHPQYSPTTFKNDIALLKLKREVKNTSQPSTSTICLPKPGDERRKYEGAKPYVAGWGAIKYNGPSSSSLREVQVPVVDTSVCVDKYKLRNVSVDSTTICAGYQQGGKDTCQGDSGGPLMLLEGGRGFTAIGIVSYGFKCAEPGYPGVYTRVGSYLDWIAATMRNS